MFLLILFLLSLTANANGDKDPFLEEESRHATESAVYMSETSTPYNIKNVTLKTTTDASVTENVTQKEIVDRKHQKKLPPQQDKVYTIIPLNQDSNSSHDTGKTKLDSRSDGHVNKLLDIRLRSGSGNFEDYENEMTDYRRSERRNDVRNRKNETDNRRSDKRNDVRSRIDEIHEITDNRKSDKGNNYRNKKDEIRKNPCENFQTHNPGDNSNTLLDMKYRSGDFDHPGLDNLPKAGTATKDARETTIEPTDTKKNTVDDDNPRFSANSYPYQPDAVVEPEKGFPQFERRSGSSVEPSALDDTQEKPVGIENLQTRRSYFKKELGPAYLPRTIELNTGEHWKDFNVLQRGSEYLSNKKFHSYLFNNDVNLRPVFEAKNYHLNGDEIPRHRPSFIPHYEERRFNLAHQGVIAPEPYPLNYHSQFPSPMLYNPNELAHKANPLTPPVWNNIMRNPVHHQRIYRRHVNDDNLISMKPRVTLDSNLRIGRNQRVNFHN